MDGAAGAAFAGGSHNHNSGRHKKHKQEGGYQGKLLTLKLTPAEATAASRARTLHLCGWDVEGVSVAGEETCIILPQAKVAFDIGRCPQRATQQQTVLFSHGHLDHVVGVGSHAKSRTMRHQPPGRYVVPPPTAPLLRGLLAACEAVAQDKPLNYEVLGMGPGEELKLDTGYVVRPFATTHTVPSQGYILYSHRKKLRPQYVGASQEELAAARAAKEEVTEVVEIPEVAFTGDTSGALFESPDCPPDLFRARLLIVECTYVRNTDVAEDIVRERGHMRLADLVEHGDRFQNEAILLIHFSARYNQRDIRAALAAGLPPGLAERCVPLLNGIPH